jgi:solute carrier family 25 (mitochondrial carnitine/acylcarnitine transporter), member 20/29
MSADFWAGYLSGAAGILIGNPLDLIKVRLQAGVVPQTSAAPLRSATSLATGAAAPVLGYGALNALLFVSYNRAEASLPAHGLWGTWIAGAVGGLATWVVSTPTELVKCRAQLAPAGVSGLGASSWAIVRHVWAAEGLKGFYFGGVVTAMRDSIGYGFYFWSYELSTRWMAEQQRSRGSPSGEAGGALSGEAARVLLCGGLAGIVTWASIFPLDVVKTRVQSQALTRAPEEASLLSSAAGQRIPASKRLGAWEVTKVAYREGGIRVFFKGLIVCSMRAFIVNAVQWAVYEWIMNELGHGRQQRKIEDPRKYSLVSLGCVNKDYGSPPLPCIASDNTDNSLLLPGVALKVVLFWVG